MRPCCALNRTRAIRPLGSEVRTSHKPSPCARHSGTAAQRHSHRPAVLNAHEVETDGLTVGLVQAPQPIPHNLGPALRAVTTGILWGRLSDMQLYLHDLYHIMYKSATAIRLAS